MKKTSVLFSLSFVLFTASTPAADFSSWTNMMPFRFAGYNPPGGTTPLTNFPALVVLSTNLAGFRYTDFNGTNADLRFTDSTTVNELNYQVEKWDPNGNSYVWVQVPRLVDSNTLICAFWGKSGQAIPAYSTNGSTWSNGYVAVWHMSETNAQDSTSNRYHCTPVANQNAQGIVGTAQSLSSSNTYMVAYPAFTNNTVTIEGWVKHNTLPASVQRYLTLGPSDAPVIRHAGNGILDYYFYDTNNSPHELQASSVLTTTGVWYHVAGTYDGANMFLFLNGNPVASATFAAIMKPRTFALFSSSAATEYMDGMMDEMRISSVARSSNWVWATWMNIASNNLLVTNNTLLKAPRPVNASGEGVTNDLFDVSRGAKVFSFSTTLTNGFPLICDPRDSLGLARSTIEPGHTLFLDGSAGTTRSISFRTASHLNLTNYQLRVFSDSGSSRTISAYALYGSADNMTYNLIDSNSVVVPYTNCPGITSTAIMISKSVNTPAYQFFRLDIKHGSTDGPRVIELDGFGKSAAFYKGITLDPIVFNSTLNAASTNTYRDQDPGYATNIASSALNANEDARQALGAAGGINDGSLLFSDTGNVPDNGDLIFGNGGETVHWIAWDTTQPLILAGINLTLSHPDRPTRLVRFSVDNVPQVFKNSGANVCNVTGISGSTNLLFVSPVRGSSFKLELTGGTNSDGVAYGPRLSEIDALLNYESTGFLFIIQ